MKLTTHLFCVLTSLLASNLVAADMPLQTGKGHRFACTDYSGKKVFIVNTAGKVEWEYETGSCNDLWVLPNGNLLFNTGNGVQEVTRDKKVVFDYKGSPFKRAVKQKDGTTKEVEGPSEIYACQRLANGNTFIGECNTGRLLVVTPEGIIVKEVRLLPGGKDGGHAYIRNARYLANGNFLVTHYAEEAVREYNPQGKLVRDIPAKGGPHSAVRLPNGNTLIAIGDRPGGGRVFEVDPAGKIVWEIKDGDLPGLPFKFMTGVQRLPNGNTVITNWLGHGKFGQSAHIIEVTPDKQIVWTFADHQTMKTISSIQLLDVPGNCLKGEILH
jgi:hypothetical protein